MIGFFYKLQASTKSSTRMILVVNKIDQVPSAQSDWDNSEDQNSSFTECVFTSAINSEGIKDLETAVCNVVGLSQIPDGGHKWTVNQVQEIANSVL